MKDIVDNRRRIDLGSKLRLARIMVQENGLLWPALIGTYYLTSGIAEASYAKAASLRAKNHLPAQTALQRINISGRIGTGAPVVKNGP